MGVQTHPARSAVARKDVEAVADPERLAVPAYGEFEVAVARQRLQQVPAVLERDGAGRAEAAKRFKNVTEPAHVLEARPPRRVRPRQQAAAATNTAELSERLDVLEGKLESAQESFATLIRSIDGFSEFTGDLSAEGNKETMAANLKEKMKLGEVSKEKVDNMVKAKAEHIGILREVEILQGESAGLSTVQKGRLANLHATAQTALELLKQVAP